MFHMHIDVPQYFYHTASEYYWSLQSENSKIFFFSVLSVACLSFLPYFIPLMRPSVLPLLRIYVGAGFLKRLIINSLLKIASFFMKEKILERIKYCTMADVKKVMPHVSTRTFD